MSERVMTEGPSAVQAVCLLFKTDHRLSPAGAPASARYVWYVIGLLSLVNVFNYMDRMALAVLLPSIKADLALSDGQLGLLVGFAFSVFYAICGIPIARWADRGVRRNIIALALITWSVMTALSGAAQSYWHLFLARVGVGAGEAGGLAPAQSMLCDYVPFKRRAGVLAIHGLGVTAGGMIGMVLAGTFNEILGWRWTFVAFGLPGIAVAILVRLSLREPVRGGCDADMAREIRPPLGEAMKSLWKCRTYRLLSLFGVTNAFLQYGLNQWLPSFYTRTSGLSISSVGVSLGVALGVGSGLGLLLGGLLANKAAQRDVRLPLIIGVVATLLALPAVLGALFISSVSVSMTLVATTGFCWSVALGPMVAAIYSVVRPSTRTTAGAIGVFCQSVLGFGLGPFCVGVVSELLAPSLGVEALRYALLVPVCLIPIMGIALYAGAKALPGDLRAIGVQV